MSLNEFKKIKHSSNPFYCYKCLNENVPFTSLTHNEFLTFAKTGAILPDSVSPNAFTPTPQLQSHINKLNSYLTKNFTNPADTEIDDTNNDAELISPINCNYFDVEEFSNAKFESSKAFSILHLNIHSIQKHIDSLRTLLLILESDKFEFDIVAISESKIMKNSPPIIDINILNYHNPISIPSEASKGGVLLYVNKKIPNFKPRPDLNSYTPKLLESAFIEIINPKKSNSIIGVVYRHPSLDVDQFNQDHIRPLLSKLSLEKNKNVFIAGDFNINLLNLPNHLASSEFFDIMSSNHLLPLISLPTKLNPSGNDTLIDNIYTNVFNPDTISGNISFNVSDGHLPSFAIIPYPNHNHLPKKHNLYKHNTKNLDPRNPNFPTIISQIKQDLDSHDWTNIIQPELADPDRALDSFNNILSPIIEKYIPLQKVKNSDYKRKFKPWISPEIRSHMRRRDQLLHKYIKAKNPITKTSLHNEYKSERNTVTELTRVSKLSFYKSYFSVNSKNLRKVWQGIKNLINIKSNSNDAPTCISDADGSIITDPTQISEKFCDQYTNVAQNILDQNVYHGDGNFEKYMPPPCPSTINIFSTVNGNEIKSIIDRFNINKSTGPSSIPSKFLHYMSDSLTVPLTLFINTCFSSGIHPMKLKIAKVVPIFKKGSKLIPANYRPISLLSNINKIIEKLVFSRVFSHIQSNNLIYNNQYGFRPKHSTDHALIQITESIREALDDGKYACAVFVDFQKAFDTVNHSILIKKLDYFGIGGKIKEWLKSYLSNRRHFVSILGYESQPQHVEHGVPQGSVLGPLLFLLYINDLHRSIKFSTTYHFADDTNMLNINSSIYKIKYQLNKDLKLLNKWLLANKISLNAAKTELIFFRKPSKKQTPLIKIKINGKRIIPVSSIKYLGVYLDEFLSGHTHCDLLHTKLSRAVGMISKIRYFLKDSKQQLISLYHSIFSSHMVFGCQTWGLHCNSKINKLQSLQNRALSLITFADLPSSPYTHHVDIYKDLRLLKLNDLITLKNLLFVHDFFNNNLPDSFADYFTLSRNIHTHGTRNSTRGLLHVPPSNSVRFGDNSFKLKTIRAWNSAVNEYPNSDFLSLSKNQFKKLMVTYLLGNY